jgi:HEAT repeat protein
VAALTESLRDSDQRVRLNAARALLEIGAEGNDAVEILSGILNARNSSGWDGVMAAEALLKKNPDSDEAIAFLRHVVQGKRDPVAFYDRLTRLRAAAVLGRTGREIELVITVLSEAAIYGDLVGLVVRLL